MAFEPLEFLMHLDRHLVDLVESYPGWIYVLLFLAVFAETGLVVMGILPGDSLLFAAGALAASHGIFPLPVLLSLFMAAAFAGDQANYGIGRLIRRGTLGGRGRLFSPARLERARRFYARHGGEAVLLGRFIPVIRSVTPLTAAIGGLPYGRFVIYSLLGSALWTALFVGIGYFLGNTAALQGRFGLVLLAIVAVTLLPGVMQYLRERMQRARREAGPTPPGRPGRPGRRQALGAP